MVGAAPRQRRLVDPGLEEPQPAADGEAVERADRGGVTMALRPEDLALGTSPSCLPGRLRRIEFQGADQLALAEAFGQPLTVRLGRGETVADPQIRIALPERPLLYDTATGDPVAIEPLAEEEQP
ncbi:P-loop NTPase family protein [Mangrovicoccus ximenensis]|uniref:hypothetical protein n=1 Tax=Mangrovicoccus ximenensis TaxID=1911570 RepID=UPI000D3B5D78|nr:hypothetical protein [Mangrovicoccus ximenensis]